MHNTRPAITINHDKFLCSLIHISLRVNHDKFSVTCDKFEHQATPFPKYPTTCPVTLKVPQNTYFYVFFTGLGSWQQSVGEAQQKCPSRAWEHLRKNFGIGIRLRSLSVVVNQRLQFVQQIVAFMGFHALERLLEFGHLLRPFHIMVFLGRLFVAIWQRIVHGA
jgi:hypothetical protein